MLWIFPIAGKGERTKSLGKYKPFIKIKGKSIIEHCLISIKRDLKKNHELLFISTKEYEKEFQVKKSLEQALEKLKIKNKIHFQLNKDHGKGPAETVYRAKKIISKSDKPIIVINSDQVTNFDLPKLKENTGFLALYLNFTKKSSYVTFDRHGYINHIVEKNPVSVVASSGVYSVSSSHDFLDSLSDHLQSTNTHKGEFYIGPALNLLIARGYKFSAIPVRAKFDLGNPKGIQAYKDWLELCQN